MNHARLAALQELGILFRGRSTMDGQPFKDNGPHTYSDHPPAWGYEPQRYKQPFLGDSDRPVFDYLPAGTTPESAVKHTRLMVLLGAADSAEFQYLLTRKDCAVLVFEPDEAALAGMLESVSMANLGGAQVFFFTGDAYSFDIPLQELLPPDLFNLGFPVFFKTQRIGEQYDRWAYEVVDYLETMFFRHRIYPLQSQALRYAHPIRDIMRGVDYDQLVHAFENTADFLKSPSMAELRNALKGETAVLVAAGPGLPEKFEWLRANADRAVIICVNNALKPLLEAGIKPHFAIINDTSVQAGDVFNHIEPTPRTILVGHCMSALGGDKFRKKFLFGEYLPEIFGNRPMLRLHGSVITTAFSLARQLGCSTCVLVGAQLCSPDPWSMSYSKGTVHEGKEYRVEPRPLIHREPQLYPVRTPDERMLYSTLNFRDAAIWFREEIRLAGIKVINTAEQSIVFGDHITYDPEPLLEERNVDRMVAGLFRVEPPTFNAEQVMAYMTNEIEKWSHLANALKPVLQVQGEPFIASCHGILKQLDANGLTHQVSRFREFDTQSFQNDVFGNDIVQQEKGFRYFIEHIIGMVEEYAAILRKQRKECANLIAPRS